MKGKLSKEEQEILRAYEKGELKSVKNLETEKKKHVSYAKAALRKDYRVNIRISGDDLRAIQLKAMEEGLPYQTFISSVIHKVAHGRKVHHPG
jgi:predicted DNA binding CopG/RHH family protein